MTPYLSGARDVISGRHAVIGTPVRRCACGDLPKHRDTGSHRHDTDRSVYAAQAHRILAYFIVLSLSIRVTDSCLFLCTLKLKRSQV